ncbi:MAG: flagellar biosynthetic protein FliQ [Verrucomicrobiales bacterium]|nr:flagellar biosynthetic protein FliQ [Verrucomicrobiales bacterium]MBR89721.1 flagellar biosynthetic protein FliQ [Verrucomicrobiales bacterium]|tara:strand:- start:1441 stop:1710 length:270 start_codon:yes stop_codon:yes gene_type:complete
MTPDYSVEILKSMMSHIVMVAAPLLIAGMVVGLVISLFQAVTSLQEQTLAFAPKALAVTGILFMLLPWVVRTLVDYTTNIFETLPRMAQ